MNTPIKSGLSFLFANKSDNENALSLNQNDIEVIINDQNYSDLDDLTLGEDTYNDFQFEVQSSLYSDCEDDMMFDGEDGDFESIDNEELYDEKHIDILSSKNLIRLIINNQFIFHQYSGDIDEITDNHRKNNLNVAELELGYSKGILTERMLCKYHLSIAPAEEDGTYMDDLPAFSVNTNILETGLNNFTLLYKGMKNRGKRINQACSLLHIRIEKEDGYESYLGQNESTGLSPQSTVVQSTTKESLPLQEQVEEEDSMCLSYSSDLDMMFARDMSLDHITTDMLQIFPSDFDTNSAIQSNIPPESEERIISDDDVATHEDKDIISQFKRINYIQLSSRKIQSNEWNLFAKLRYDVDSESLLPGELAEQLISSSSRSNSIHIRRPSIATSIGTRSEDIKIITSTPYHHTESKLSLADMTKLSRSSSFAAVASALEFISPTASTTNTNTAIRKDSISSNKSFYEIHQQTNCNILSQNIPTAGSIVLNPHSSSSFYYNPTTVNVTEDTTIDIDSTSNPTTYISMQDDTNELVRDYMSKMSFSENVQNKPNISNKKILLNDSKIVSLNDIREIQSRNAMTSSSIISDITSVEFSLNNSTNERNYHHSRVRTSSMRSTGNSTVYSNHSTRHTNNDTSTPSASSISSKSSRHKYSQAAASAASTLSAFSQQPIKLSSSSAAATRDMSCKPYSVKDLLEWESSSSSSDSDSIYSGGSGHDSGFHEGIFNAYSCSLRDVNNFNNEEDFNVETSSSEKISSLITNPKRARFDENPVNITYSHPDNTNDNSTFLTRLFSTFGRYSYSNSSNASTSSNTISTSRRNLNIDEKISRIPEGDDEDNSDFALTPRDNADEVEMEVNGKDSITPCTL